MATSRAPVVLQPGVWTDVYAATSITVGTQLIVQNTSKDIVNWSEASSEPSSAVGFNQIYPGQFLTTTLTQQIVLMIEFYITATGLYG